MNGQKASGMCRANNCDMGPRVSIGISFDRRSEQGPELRYCALKTQWPFLAAAR